MKPVLTLLLLLLTPLAWSHEVRPAYLELRESSAGVFDVLWKVPSRGEWQLNLSPTLPASAQAITPAISQQRGNAAVQTWLLRAPELRGQTIGIAGLEHTLTDALVRIEFNDGSHWLKRLTPNETQAAIPVRPAATGVMQEYFVLGVEHILLGIDHLLFVLGLLLITPGRWQLIKAITAFTVAHSITLAAATLQIVRVPVAPVEAVIALSIVFVAMEKIHADRGRTSLALRSPWIVAFLFGLLHGLGFAAALSEVGLPEQHIPLALLFFNVGVEAGQLLFVAVVLSSTAALTKLWLHRPGWLGQIPTYAIGSLAMFWVFERTAAI
jgi:hydrogenase/urease accessory protein HupE